MLVSTNQVASFVIAMMGLAVLLAGFLRMLTGDDSRRDGESADENRRRFLRRMATGGALALAGLTIFVTGGTLHIVATMATQ